MANYQSRYTGPEIDRRLGLMAGNFLWMKWSPEYPVTAMQDEPAAYVGVYAGEADEAPTDPLLYKWYFHKGDPGERGLQGEKGDAGTGNNWYEGTAITGTSTTPTVYATGIIKAQVGDMYINKGALPDTGRVYRCTAGGNAATALWVYSMLLRGADGTGVGDMLASVYVESVGVVKNSARLGGQLPAYYLPAAQKGAASGIAELDASGKVLSSQLPSYVDDVINYATSANFPATGEDGKIYIANNTNLCYRWNGSSYTEISPSIALGETPSTAYRGDRGKAAYEHSLLTGNPHSLTLAALGGVAAPSQLTALPTSGTALANNSEYRVAAAVGTYAFAWPVSPFEAWLMFTTSSTPSITFPAGTKYIGGAPSFEASKTYEMSVKDGVVIVKEVTAS